jgi:ubiquinone biosynthesis protein UbiJ
MDLPFQDLWLPAVRNRMVLFANHVLTGCPPAVERLRAHAGKAVRVDVSGWPGLIPVPPPLTLRITPAGLFEAVETAGTSEAAAITPDLNVRIDASEPTKVAGNVFKGGLPPMSIDGDGALAADVNWIVQNVRWDPAADAERFFGPTLAEGVSRASAQFAQAAEVAKKAMGQMFDMLQARNKS